MDIYSILAKHNPKKAKSKEEDNLKELEYKKATYSQIPDIFFDEILPHFVLSRSDISVLFLIYRIVWTRPNLHRSYGISPILQYGEMAEVTNLSIAEIYSSIKRLEGLGLVEVIRSGQFFIRKFLTEEFDQLYDQKYDNF